MRLDWLRWSKKNMLLFFRLDGRTSAQLRPEAMDFGAGVFRVTALSGADGPTPLV